MVLWFIFSHRYGITNEDVHFRATVGNKLPYFRPRYKGIRILLKMNLNTMKSIMMIFEVFLH